MSAEWQEWEGVAREYHDATGVDDPPVDAFVAARRARLRVEYSVGPGTLDLERRVIRVNPRQHPRHVQIDVAHELGHYLLERAGAANTEPAAKYLSGAILGPRRHVDRDLAERGWSVRALQERHRHMPALALALRITQLRDAVATIFDPRGRLAPWRRASPWITDPALTGKPSRLERDFALRAFELGADLTAEAGEERGLHATVVLDEYDDGPRVVVVRDLRQLALRFHVD